MELSQTACQKSLSLENFVASAIAYRPEEFGEVIGQEAITRTLENSIQSEQIPKALLFCGPRGVGKTTCARILARRINETDETKAKESDFAFNIFELDAASNNTVDDIRALIDQVRIPPQTGKYKVYIIDEVHMLSASAFNAFLKTLEEPPKHAVFILATTEKHKIIPTILSRCQIYDFKRIRVRDMVEHLQTVARQRGVSAEEDALFLIAQKADGAMRDALSIFDRIAAYSDNHISRQKVSEVLQVLDHDTYMEFTRMIAAGDIPALIARFNEISMQGFDGQQFIIGLADHFRDLLVASSAQTRELLDTGDDLGKQLAELSSSLGRKFLVRAIELATDCDYRYKTSSNQRLLVEITLMKLASIGAGEDEKKKDSLILPASRFKNGVPAAAVPTPYRKETAQKNHTEAHQVTEPPVHTEPAENRGIEIRAEETSPAPKRQSRSGGGTATIGEKEVTHAASTPTPQKTTKPAAASQESANRENQEEVAPSISALSLSSIRRKKQHKMPQSLQNREKEEPLRDAPVLLEEVQTYWRLYADRLEQKGEKILASCMNVSPPHALDGTVLKVSLPNETMKKSLELGASSLLAFLRDKLGNDHLRLEVTIIEGEERKYIYTPEEKYDRLREKNPDIELLRKGLDLDF